MDSLILHGRRLVQLQKWRHLSVSVQMSFAFSNSFSSATVSDVRLRDGRKGNNFTISYLVNSLGLTTKLAESVLSKVSSVKDKANPDSVLKLLRSHGFTDSQISTIITDYPRLLILDAEKSLAPRLQFLQTRGASSSELTQIISIVPQILGRRGHKTISVFYDFIKDTLDHKSYEKSCHSFPQGNLENKIRNVSVLRELGLPQKLLFSLLISCDGPVFGKEKFEESLKKVLEMGFDPTSAKFVDALRAVQGLSDKTIEGKINAYKRLGFDADDVWAVFKKWPNLLAKSEKKIENSIETFLALGFSRDEFATIVKCYPQCIDYSVESVKTKIELLVKKMNWPVKALIMFPLVLGYSMEKRIVPRCNVIKALMSKGLLGDRGSELPPMQSVLNKADQIFLKRYVTKHDDKELVAELMAIFTGGRVSLEEEL
ncbi:Transcription termination factor MTERF2 [Cardamine amara subsp. amara]|uniref:Transcription termination factor MTERF2 n=1 Tax=Cardamine amara subsp. amara TaxID=228776 RepID=A0ABD1C9E5_CARAN